MKSTDAGVDHDRGGDGFLMIDDDMPPPPTVIPTPSSAPRALDRRPIAQEEFPALPMASASFEPSLPRKVLSRRACPCGRQSQSVLVDEGTPIASLSCDAECEAVKRRARLADAFNIDTATYNGAFESSFSIDLITWARQHPKRVEAIERQLHEKLTRRDEQRFRLDRIPKEWKKLVIEWVDNCGAVGRSIHSSDAVEVILTDRCHAPAKKLSQYATSLTEAKYQELVKASLKNVILLEDVTWPIDLRKILITWDGDYEFERLSTSNVKLTFRTESAFRSACIGLGGGVKNAFKVNVPLKPESESASDASSFPTASERRPWTVQSKNNPQATERLHLENSFELSHQQHSSHRALSSSLEGCNHRAHPKLGSISLMVPCDFRGYYASPHTRAIVPQRPEEEGNVILCMVDNMMFPITEEALETVVKAYGDVIQRVIYERSGVWQAVVQYASATSANSAKQALEGHAIYEGGYNKLRVFNSSKNALSFAKAATTMPEYKMSDQEAASIRAVVNGDDYFRAHSDIGRGALAALSGQPLPPSFVPTTLPQAGSSPPVATIPPMYVRSADPYMNPPAGPYPPTPMTSYHPMPANFQRMQDMRYPRPVPMTTYQHHPHSMPSQPLSTRNSHGLGMMSGGVERPKQI